MGILNITNDSFYAGSRLNSTEMILEKAAQMIQDGADILDIGAQSTRPGSERISAKEEIEKAVPAIQSFFCRNI
jgi:dihydropteroate synthase